MAPLTNPIDLTTLSRVKTRAEVASTNNDQEIQDAITAFSQWILDYTGQKSLNAIASYDEVYDGNGNSRLFLRNYPIQTLVGVTVNGVAIPASSGFNSWGAFVDQSRKSICIRGGLGNFSTFPYPSYQALQRAAPAFIRGLANIGVQYTAGYPQVTITNEIDTIASQTIALQNSPWAADGGVKFYPSLVPLTLVPSAPAAGQYAVSGGLYTFNAADNAAQVAVTYNINQGPYDLEYAVRCVVAINYKRKSWQDQKSKATTSGGSAATTSFMNWTWPPEYQQIFDHYQRKAIIV